VNRFPLVETLSLFAPDRPALYWESEGRWVTYGELAERVTAAAQSFARLDKSLACVLFSNSVDDVIAYLGLMSAGHVPMLLDPALDGEMLGRLLETYCPEFLVGAAVTPPSGWQPIAGVPAWSSPSSEQPSIHPSLCLLLTTSGSTGSPKMVRLSAKAVGHNTQAIIRALSIGETDRAIAHLPLHYSFGLSVLHTHLLVGASVLLTSKSMVEADFWDQVRGEAATSLPGTPFHIQMIDRLGLDQLDLPFLSVLTQAGGRLAPELAARMHGVMAARGGRFYVMYGQTEASPRMTTLAPDRFSGRAASVGRSLMDGTILIVDSDGKALPSPQVGEVVFRGPNVMMGYAQCREDLILGDETDGELRTGDLGYLDDDGFLFLTGRVSRFAKIAGHRINLDELEGLAHTGGRIAAIERNGQLVLFGEHLSEPQSAQLHGDLVRRLHLHSRGLVVRSIEVIPVTAKGKVDYLRLGEMI
jgi:acyl-CoA synthetase (AMP-forming)/AMP-acid ligase II